MIKLLMTTMLLCFFSSAPSFALEVNQHLKYSFSAFHFDDDSVFLPFEDQDQQLHDINYRANLSTSLSAFNFEAHYQLQLLNSQQLDNYIDPDNNRLFDFSSVIDEQNNQLMHHRLDRLSLGYSTATTTTRFGRQAVTWGNGFVFNVMDIFNPFSPTAIDKEYKPGDDMLYFQLLTEKAADWQFIHLLRRDNNDDIESEQASSAIKLQSTFSSLDIDLLLARHYRDNIIGLGISQPIKDSLWRFDITHTQLDSGKSVTSVSTNIDYSWQSLGKNFYCFLEYYHNGFGIRDASDPLSLSLTTRLSRGELFARFRNYLSAGLRIELHPLLNFSPTLINNLDDQSSLLSLSLDYSWQQNLNLSTQLVSGLGDSQSEYNGNAAAADNLTFLLGYYF